MSLFEKNILYSPTTSKNEGNYTFLIMNILIHKITLRLSKHKEHPRSMPHFTFGSEYYEKFIHATKQYIVHHAGHTLRFYVQDVVLVKS